MRFATRTFLWTFLPFAIMLTGTFWAIEHLVISSVRNELSSSLRRTQKSLAGLRSQNELQNRRFLRLVGENATLIAGLQLTRAEPGSIDARRTLEEQLREICATMRFDLLVASDADGKPIAGVMRSAGQVTGMDMANTEPPRNGFFTVNGIVYQVASVEVNQSDEALGVLAVGERFDFAQFSTPAVLTRRGKVVKLNLAGLDTAKLEGALGGCAEGQQCQFELNGETYISLALSGLSFGDGYLLQILESVDAAVGPVQRMLRNVFLLSGLGVLAAAFVIALFSSRSVVRPLWEVVEQLRISAREGGLPRFQIRSSAVHEIDELTSAFRHAADVIHQ